MKYLVFVLILGVGLGVWRFYAQRQIYRKQKILRDEEAQALLRLEMLLLNEQITLKEYQVLTHETQAFYEQAQKRLLSRNS
ncbi:MAG: hypothetical protein Q4B71_04150 [Cardiobacteriaceae bacterium]|nr:hypothetical protein [Cardiobacteriaceae bacterium]